ncbi:MAG: ferritin family protein [Bacillota bacterium]
MDYADMFNNICANRMQPNMGTAPNQAAPNVPYKPGQMTMPMNSNNRQMAMPSPPYNMGQMAMPNVPYKPNEMAMPMTPYNAGQMAMPMTPYNAGQMAMPSVPYKPNEMPMPVDPYNPDENLSAALMGIQDAVMGETEDQMFYSYLINEAPSDEDKKIIMGIRNDEMKHYKMFRQLYYELTGNTLPESQDTAFEKPASYCEGLKKALLGEQNAVRKYRNILFAMKHRRHINMVTEIITDELRHLGLYNFLYAKNGCSA